MRTLLLMVYALEHNVLLKSTAAAVFFVFYVLIVRKPGVTDDSLLTTKFGNKRQFHFKLEYLI